MNLIKHPYLILLSLTLSILMPVGLAAQKDIPNGPPDDVQQEEEDPEEVVTEDTPEDTTPPSNVPNGPSEGVPQGPPEEVAIFLEALHALREDFLSVVHDESYANGEERAAAIQQWLETKGADLEALEAWKDDVQATGDDIEMPENDLVGELTDEIEALEEAEEELEEGLGAIMSRNFASEQERQEAIQAWKTDHAAEIAAQQSAREDILAQMETARSNAQNRGARPEASQNMRDLETLFDSVLAGVGANNQELRNRLQAAEIDRENFLRELKESREARLQEMESIRDIAKQQREEARQNIDGDRRPPDDG